jgi:S1-C subfamily serine protease
MKVNCSIWLILVLMTVAAVGQQPAGSKYPPQITGGQIVTRKGVTYKGVVVQKVVPDGLVIAYSQADGGLGFAKLKFKDLSDSLQQQFGYNPTNAAAFEAKQKTAESQWQEKWKVDDEKAQEKNHEQQIADAESRASRVGTGFFISSNGYFLTCFHVVKNASSIEVGTIHGLFSAELVQSDPAKDVALLKVAGTFASLPLASTTNILLGEAVFTIGFPDPGLQGWQPKLTRGEISSLSGMQDDPDNFQISVPVQPGNSGGALVDERGNVVGIVAAKLKGSVAELLATGVLPENVNYAVKSSCAKTLLDSVPGDLLRLKPENLSDGRKFEDVVQASQDALVLVLVQ